VAAAGSTDAGSHVIVVAGEALVDVVLDHSDRLLGHPGGGPYNVARTIGRLEQPAVYLGRISTDRFGQRLRRELEDDGVRLDAVVPTADPTTLALAEMDGGGIASYRFYTAGTSTPGLTPEDALGALPERVAMLHVGTLGLVLEPMAGALEAVVREASDETLVALDPNCRPAVIDDVPAYRERLSRILRRTDLLKASEDDLAWLAPDQDPTGAARAFLHEGPAVAVVTRGPRGALVVTPSEVITVPAAPARVIDTIGAGDAFGGAFLAWWHEHALGRTELGDRDAVVEATTFACLVAARTCERAGAVPPRASDLAPRR
jgi:fructokinase